MNKRLLIIHWCISFTLCSFMSIHSVAQKTGVRPNIIYIMADDLGYADLSSYGRKDYQTPNLDRLASQGIRFTNAYAAAPVCTPTRAAFFTGRYPARTPVGLREPLEWSAKDSLIGLTPEYTSLPAMLKKAGYETYLVGKWHLGFNPQASANKNGFDYFFGFHGGGLDYISHNAPKARPDLYENEQPINRNGYLTDMLKEKTVEIINKVHEKPFFLALMFNAPHWPWQAPGDKAYGDTMHFASGGSAASYAGMMKSMDDAVGAIVSALDQKKLTANTIIIFTSDNGGERFSDMGMFKGKKMQLWEGGIREPAFVKWPGKIARNSSTNQVITTMDWTATILAVAGAKPDPAFPLDGIDIMPVCMGKQKEQDRTLYWRIFQRAQQKAMRQGKWKYLQDEKGEYLFDLSKDPAENNDLKSVEKQLFNSLKQKYAAWELTVLKPIPL
jgi:arylsulfatase A-like enzyme